jgi:ABC-type phosphate transport system substrate-binding protein
MPSITAAIKLVASLLRTPRLWLLALPLLIAGAHAQTPEAAVVVIVHPAMGSETIPRSSLRAIVGMRLQKWPVDAPVKVFVLRDDSPEHATFSKTILQVFPHQLRMAWDRQVFSGQGQYPEQVGSTQEMLSRVASTPGAIGYVKASEVNQNVRVLKIR